MSATVWSLPVLSIFCLIVCFCGVDSVASLQQIVYEWPVVDYEWPNASMRQDYIRTGKYIPANNAINGIKIYKGKIYVTVPRLKYGIPSTLNVVVDPGTDGTSAAPILRPFPSWDMQKEGDCRALQIVQSMEIDINTGNMWILDTAYVPKNKTEVRPFDACQPKLIIWNIDNNTEVSRYTFPLSTIGHGRVYLNDIVLDFVNKTAAYAYISDTLDYKLVVYNLLRNISYYFTHPSMKPEAGKWNITIANVTYMVPPLGINGLAMSADFTYLYYSPLAGHGLHQIPTSVLRDSESEFATFYAAVKTVGDKVSQGDGMMYGRKRNLYFSAFAQNAVYKWELGYDADNQNLQDSLRHLKMETQTVVADDEYMEWVDAFALDDEGYLWYTTNGLHKSVFGEVDTNVTNFRIWKVFVDDHSYLELTDTKPTTSGTGPLILDLKLFVFICITIAATFH